VQIGEGTTLINCTVQGPAAIGRDCHLENCWVGPYSSIADAATLRDVTVEQSVILEGAIVMGAHQRIVDSVIGQRAQVKSTSVPKALRLLIGDDSQIELE
jgi:glucose-1-phosphate thymidylyltransferase